MKIFKDATYTWWQIGLLKLSLLSVGIAIGAHWSEVFSPFTGILILLGIVLGVYLAYKWLSQ